MWQTIRKTYLTCLCFVVDFIRRGGDEVLVDVAGQEATEAYDDAGHSDEADKILAKYLVGKLDAPKSAAAGKTRNKGGKSQRGLGTMLLWIALVLIAILAAGVAFSTLKNEDDL